MFGVLVREPSAKIDGVCQNKMKYGQTKKNGQKKFCPRDIQFQQFFVCCSQM
jgi:hypothetical protein